MARETDRKKIVLSLALAALLIFLSMTAATVWTVLHPTFEYYGQVLSAGEFLDLVNQGGPTACVQIPIPWFNLIALTGSYACFDTEEEMDAYLREVVHAG